MAPAWREQSMSKHARLPSKTSELVNYSLTNSVQKPAAQLRGHLHGAPLQSVHEIGRPVQRAVVRLPRVPSQLACLVEGYEARRPSNMAADAELRP